MGEAVDRKNLPDLLRAIATLLEMDIPPEMNLVIDLDALADLIRKHNPPESAE